jgi:poly-gamma-glutamate capsule biosynthesis protein CapA/YwtB (metallophosphatase superfamily)
MAPTNALISPQELEIRLTNTRFSLLAVGDIMLGARARKPIGVHGSDYPFAATLPLLRAASVVFGNLEAPFACKARKLPRNHSYRVNPALACSLKEAGFHVVSLANNHLLDCGREGVQETIDALACANLDVVGAGANKAAAHTPSIRVVGNCKIGLLGYYWNSRCAATEQLPGSATDAFSELELDIGKLRTQVDRIVVSFHWGIPYERQPSAEDRAKARWAIECGADCVIGHHPHVIQPLEIYRGRPIFYSLGNYMLGSGNSKAEGLAVGFDFDDRFISVSVIPLYVKNRDPLVNYQPKVVGGQFARSIIKNLAASSGASGELLQCSGDWGYIHLPAGLPKMGVD